MPWASRVLSSLAVALATSACAGARTPSRPPQADADARLHIDVEIDGRSEAPIDARRLAAAAPDFADEEHRAWKLRTLLGATVDRDGAVVAVTGASGVTVLMPRPKTANDPLPVLTVTRRGAAAIAMVRPDEPFPAYHGQGRARHRPGDPLPRVAPVAHVRVFVEGAATPSGPSIEAKVRGQPSRTWSVSALERVPRLEHAAVGEDRDAWSLREIARVLVGPSARVVAVVGDDERRPIDARAWEDADRIPILRVAGGGHRIKFRWIERGELREAEVKNVRAIEIEP